MNNIIRIGKVTFNPPRFDYNIELEGKVTINCVPYPESVEELVQTVTTGLERYDVSIVDCKIVHMTDRAMPEKEFEEIKEAFLAPTTA